MEFRFSGEIIEWRGPAPHYWVAMPEEDGEWLIGMPELSYGWGCIAAMATIGRTRYRTALMPKDGNMLVPVKVAVRRAEGVGPGDVVDVCVEIGEPGDRAFSR